MMRNEYYALILGANPKPEIRNKSEFQMTKIPNDEICKLNIFAWFSI